MLLAPIILKQLRSDLDRISSMPKGAKAFLIEEAEEKSKDKNVKPKAKRRAPRRFKPDPVPPATSDTAVPPVANPDSRLKRTTTLLDFGYRCTAVTPGVVGPTIPAVFTHHQLTKLNLLSDEQIITCDPCGCTELSSCEEHRRDPDSHNPSCFCDGIYFCPRHRPLKVEPDEDPRTEGGQTTEECEVVPHISEIYARDEGRDSQEIADPLQRQASRGDDSPRGAQGRNAPSPRTATTSQTFIDSKEKILRLRCKEAWQLSDSQEPLRELQLSEQNRQGAPMFWEYTDSWVFACGHTNRKQGAEKTGWWRTYTVKGFKDSRRFTLWCIDSGDITIRPWILFAEQTKDRRLRCLVLSSNRERIVKAMATTRVVQGHGHYNIYDRRVVELEYHVQAIFQTTAALRVWTKANLQDGDGGIAKAILDDIRRPEGGGFLRHVRREHIQLDLDGRVPRTEDDPVFEREPPGLARNMETEGKADQKERKPPLDHNSELDTGADLPQVPSEEPQQAGHPQEQTLGDRTPEADRHSRARRSIRTRRLRFSEEPSRLPRKKSKSS